MKKVKLHNPFKPRIMDEKKLREHLALERTKLANERTLLAYIRASLYLLVGGTALLQLKDNERIIHYHWDMEVYYPRKEAKRFTSTRRR